MIYALDGQVPDIHPTAWVAPDANIIGRVRLGPGASVWFGATLRGDNEWIEIGEGSNVQENSVLHTDMGFPLVVGTGCTIGHRAMLHGCTIGDGSLVGMGATVLNGAVIGERSLVGACALVTERKRFEAGMMILGAPAKAVRALGNEEIDGLARPAQIYQRNAVRFRDGLQRLGTTPGQGQ